MLPVIVFASLLSAITPRWYGPATASFPVEFAGNPYDSEVNDIRVRFTDEKGAVTERLGYYDDGEFKAVLVADHPARWTAVLIRNGQKVQQANREGILEVRDSLPHGYIRVDPILKNRFVYDDGTPYVPIGLNQAWADGKPESTIDTIRRMSDAGMTWSRIWSASWEGKNPWFPSNQDKPAPGEMWAPALDFWQKEIDEISKTQVAFQFVLHNHGSVSSMVDPNWNDNPWNAAKGGFLKDPVEFFTDAEAKRRTKMWLRYAVARYGWSPSILAWELFNEVENTNAGRTNQWPVVFAWHDEMAAYIRSLDPYHHLVTTSSAIDHPELFANMDYLQPHTYPASVLAAVMSVKLPEDKPIFFGEFGPPNGTDAEQREGVRDGVFGGIFSRQAGAAQYWYGDRAEKNGVFAELGVASKAISLSGWASHPRARAADVGVKSAQRAPLAFAPGAGWAPSTLETMSLPQDATPVNLAKISAYFQSETGGHKDMAKPIRLRFTSPAAGKVEITFGESSSAGGHITVRVNGAAAFEQDIKAATKLEIPIPAGAVQFDITNTGADWVRVEKILIPGIGTGGQAGQLFEDKWAMLRVKATAAPVAMTLTGIQLPNGKYDVQEINLISGEVKPLSLTVTNGELSYQALGPDTMLVFQGAA